MDTITQVAQAMQQVLGPISDYLAYETCFSRRESPLNGSRFIQTLVGMGLQKSDWSLESLVASAADVGIVVTQSAISQRFTKESAKLTRRVLETAVKVVIETERKALPLLERFQGVYIRDSSVISLPKELQSMWPGCGGSAGDTSEVKLHVRLEVSSGQLGGPILAAGKEHDSHSEFQTESLPTGAVRMGDLGFFSLNQFEDDSKHGIFWLSRYKTGTLLFDEEGQAIDLLNWLQQQKEVQFERSVQIGKTHHLACRLLVEHLPQEAAEKRRRKLREYARKKQTPLNEEALALAEWTLLITNIPPTLLSIPEALVLLRVRWQIELLFKRWKSLFKIDEWASSNIWRILTELYAKLLTAVITHWIQLTAMWHIPHPSFWKSVLVVRRFATLLTLSFSSVFDLESVLSMIHDRFTNLCHLDKRKSHPSLYQLLENPSCTTLA